MPTLADMLSQYNRILALDDEELTEEETTLKTDTLSELTEATADKVDAISEYLRSATAQIKHWREEAQRFANKAQSAEAHLEYMKCLWQASMMTNGLTEIKGKSYAIKLRKTQHVVVEDVNRLDSEFIRIKREPDKAKLKELLKAGAVIDGAVLEEAETLLVR